MIPASVKMTISNLEQGTWVDMWDKSINPIQATAYGHKYVPGAGLILSMYHKDSSYGGWLCKNTTPLPAQMPNMNLVLGLIVDQLTANSAQVIEIDHKVTDAAGYTYDGSAQLNLVKNPGGWLLQVGAPWSDTNVVIPPIPAGQLAVLSVNGSIDYNGHTSQITSLDVTTGGTSTNYPVNNPQVTPAKQINWTKSSIITQLQQCNNGKPGGYTLTFPSVGYTLSF